MTRRSAFFGVTITAAVVFLLVPSIAGSDALHIALMLVIALFSYLLGIEDGKNEP